MSNGSLQLSESRAPRKGKGLKRQRKPLPEHRLKFLIGLLSNWPARGAVWLSVQEIETLSGFSRGFINEALNPEKAAKRLNKPPAKRLESRKDGRARKIEFLDYLAWITGLPTQPE